jgi:DNA-directed RNA polymerase subunit RPC12/RpoP
MALVKCEECGHPVSTKAIACPHCGARMIPVRRLAVAIVVGLLLALGIMVATTWR